MLKKISVALATYNGSNYIERQLNSILSQSYPVEEIIIVDDCSTDNTRDILAIYQQKFSHIKVFVNECNMRSNLSFKRAIALTNCDYVALCDQDDIWDNDKVEIQIDQMLKIESTAVGQPLLIYHDLRLINEKEIITHDSFWKLHGFEPQKFSYNNLFLFNVVTGCTCLINKVLKEQFLKCDMKNIMMHDYLIALIAYGYGQAIGINKSLMLYRSHSNSVTFKETLSFLDRFTSLVSRIKNGEYLKPYILQMEKFHSLYGNRLDQTKLLDTNAFIQLKHKSLMRKFFYKWLK